MPLSDASKLAIELCEKLGIPYRLGTGEATLCGVPMDEIPANEPFPENDLLKGNYVVSYQVEPTSNRTPRIPYMPNSYIGKGIAVKPTDETYTINASESISLVA